MARDQAAEKGRRREPHDVTEAARHPVRARRRWMGFGGGVVAAAAVAGAVTFALHGNGSSATTSAAAAALGLPSNVAPPSPTGQFTRTGFTLYQGKKPEILFIGALYCPHCGVERWAIVKALDQFGRFSNARQTTNGQGIPTFDLTRSRYSSPYVAFVHKDVEDQSYNRLQSLTPAENTLVNRYDTTGAIPLVLVDGYAMNGSPIDVGELQDRPFAAVQSSLKTGAPQPFVRDINAETNVLTALLCRADGMRPGSVCDRPVIRHLTIAIR